MNEERRKHGAVEESSSKQQICESDNHTYIDFEENWSLNTSGTGSYVSQACRPSDENLVVSKSNSLTLDTS